MILSVQPFLHQSLHPRLRWRVGGGVSVGVRVLPLGTNWWTWVKVVKTKDSTSSELPASINQRDNLEKLKKSVSDVVLVDKEMKERAFNRMNNTLFGKFMGKAPPLELVRKTLLEMWRGMGQFSVSDMSNGFYLI